MPEEVACLCGAKTRRDANGNWYCVHPASSSYGIDVIGPERPERCLHCGVELPSSPDDDPPAS